MGQGDSEQGSTCSDCRKHAYSMRGDLIEKMAANPSSILVRCLEDVVSIDLQGKF